MNLNPIEMYDKLNGVIGLLPTHFNNDGSLDLGAMCEASEFACLEFGKDEKREGAIMIAGSTSEFYAMTDAESLAMIDAVVKTVNGRVPVIAGTGRAATALTIDFTRKARDLGIDCALVSNPFYMQMTDEGLYRHFSMVADSTDVGIMIYNNPSTSKMYVPPYIMGRLADHPNIIASKENTTTIEKYYWMLKETQGKTFKVCCGIGHLNYMFEAPYGCPAYVTELLLIAPDMAFGLHQACKNKNYEKAIEIMDRLIPYHKFIGKCVARRNVPTTVDGEIGGRATCVYQSILKKSMELCGLPGGIVREPLENISDSEVEELRKVLIECKIIKA